MKKVFTRALLFFLLSIPFLSQAQTYENSWIDFSKKYYKLKVWQTGLYRLTRSDLANNGVINSFPFNDPRRIQIYYKGAEQYIYIYDANGNNLWDAVDYIEFFGQK